MPRAAGACLCGAVRFTAELPSKWVAHCHCTMCQRAHGAAFVTWVGMDETRCSIEDAHLAWYESSPGARRGFCTRCGSTLFFQSQRWAGELHITLANFTTPVDRAPQSHSFYDTHVEWFSVNDGLPQKPAAKS